MSTVLVLCPGPLAPGVDAGVDTLAALAVRRLERDHTRVVALSPTPTAGAALFASRAYAEPLDARAIMGAASREGASAIVAAFAGKDGLALACGESLGAPILGLHGRARSAGFPRRARASATPRRRRADSRSRRGVRRHRCTLHAFWRSAGRRDDDDAAG
ncbi:MAG: hypothetical protein U0235_15340 [Polyangiaceae bacterium]